jgi:ribonuclease-3
VATAVTTRAARQSRLSSATLTSLEVLGVPAELGPLYELALTHRSFAFEQPEAIEHNERLEFLGDAILGAVVTDLIYNKFPDLPEGDLARLRASVVNTVALAQIARSVGLGEHLKLGKGEEGSGGRDKASLLADSFEAVIGAVYLDRGIEQVATVLRPLFDKALDEVVAGGMTFDAKTALQEAAVKLHGEVPTYRVASSGPDHDKRFTAHVFVGGDSLGAGTGRSKKEAEQQAAREALDKLEEADDARAS